MSTRSLIRRIDLIEAVRYDIHLHGFPTIFAEFLLAALGAVAIAIVELLHAGNGGAPLLGGLWFLGVALKCFPVVLLSLHVRRAGTDSRHGKRRPHLYVLELVVMLLMPRAVV